MCKIPNSTAIPEWKNKALSMILGEDEILSLFEKSDEQLENIVYSNIFPYGYIPETQEQADLYMTLEVSIPKIVFRHIWEYPQLKIKLICHQSRMKLKKAGVSATRIDYLSQLIDKLLNGSSDWGYGNLILVSNVEYNLSATYKVREMIFQGQDLSNDLCDKKGQKR